MGKENMKEADIILRERKEEKFHLGEKEILGEWKKYIFW